MLAGFSESVSDQELAKELAKDCKVLKTNRDKVLFRQDEPPDKLYLLHSGTVILKMKLQHGDEVLGFKAQPGHLIGLPAIAGCRPYSMTATASEGTELCVMTMEHFRQIISRNPRLSFRILQILATEVHSARRLLGTMLSTMERPQLALDDLESGSE